MLLSRRTFITAAGATLFLPTGATSSELTVGAKTVRTVSDGNLVLPVSFVLPEIPVEEARAFLESQGLSTDRLEPECNLTLLEDGERVILFDAGSGSNFMPSAGKLGDALANAGVEPETVTDVIFTHAHPDHLWGILDDFDEITFPEAQLHMCSAEWNFWRSSDVFERVGENRQAFAAGAQNRMAIMEDRIQLFDAGAEVLPGVEAVDTSGHTPGHMAFAIHSSSEYLMVVGDALTNHAFSFQRPDWPTGSDQDPQKGIATRLALLDRLATDKAAIIGFHLPNGGAGSVERDGQAYRFVQG